MSNTIIDTNFQFPGQKKVYKGKVYLVQVRDKDQIDEAYKNIKIGIQVPKVESKDLN